MQLQIGSTKSTAGKHESLPRTRSWPRCLYAAFFCPTFNFAHRARCAAATLLRTDTDMVRFTVADPVVFAAAAECEPFRARAHLAFCASAIFRREAADIVRFGWFTFRDALEAPND
jgi:hypothetical protein